jgi:hypothetical protein
VQEELLGEVLVKMDIVEVVDGSSRGVFQMEILFF